MEKTTIIMKFNDRNSGGWEKLLLIKMCRKKRWDKKCRFVLPPGFLKSSVQNQVSKSEIKTTIKTVIFFSKKVLNVLTDNDDPNQRQKMGGTLFRADLSSWPLTLLCDWRFKKLQELHHQEHGLLRRRRTNNIRHPQHQQPGRLRRKVPGNGKLQKVRSQSHLTFFFVKRIFFYLPKPFQNECIFFFCYKHLSLMLKIREQKLVRLTPDSVFFHIKAIPRLKHKNPIWKYHMISHR